MSDLAPKLAALREMAERIAGPESFAPAQCQELARAVLTMLPVVEATAKWRNSLGHEDEMLDALETLSSALPEPNR